MAQISNSSMQRVKEQLILNLAQCQKESVDAFDHFIAKKQFEEFLQQSNDDDSDYEDAKLDGNTVKAYKIALQSENSKTTDKFKRMLDIASKQLQFRLKEFILDDKTYSPQVEEEEETAVVFEEDSDEGDDAQINELKDLLRKEKQDLYNLVDDVVNSYQDVLTNERKWLISQIQQDKGETKNRGFEE